MGVLKLKLCTFVLSLFLCLCLCCAEPVNVSFCNGYPGSGYVSISWHFSDNSTRIPYKSCSVFTTDDSWWTGEAYLWSSVSSPTPMISTFVSIVNGWCADSNRNIIFVYEADNMGTLGVTYPQQNGGIAMVCDPLPPGAAVRYIFNALCGHPVIVLSDVIYNSKLVQPSVYCYQGTNYAATVAPANSFFDGSTMWVEMAKAAGPSIYQSFAPAIPNPAPGQSVLLILSGDARYPPQLWTYTTQTFASTPARGRNSEHNFKHKLPKLP